MFLYTTCVFLFVQILTLAGETKICQPFPVDNTGPALPKLPLEFQVRVESSIKNRNKTLIIHEYYDYNDNKAAINLFEDGDAIRMISDYNNNKLLLITNGKCEAKKINESLESTFFGLQFNSDGTELIGTPSSVFHFNNGYNQKYIGEEVIRGIPVNHWQSCQNWSQTNSNFQLDFYFSKKGYNSSVIWDKEILEIPIMARIEGVTFYNNDDSANFLHEYNFFEFRSFVEDKANVFMQPDGIFCSDTKVGEDLPELPAQFQYTEETVSPTGQITVSKVFYDFNGKVLRLDTLNSENPISVVHDFTTGVGYIINKNFKNCTTYSLGNGIYDAIDIDSSYTSQNVINGLSYSIIMKNPQAFFYLDNSYYFFGEKLHRGILCEVFISNRTDFNVKIGNQKANYTIFEWFFMSNLWNDQSFDQTEKVNPVAVIIRIPEFGITIINNIFDFDSTVSLSTFDATQCYNGKQKNEFSISFSYSGIDEQFFQSYFKKFVEGFFLVPLFESVSEYTLSPLRFIAPRAQAMKDKFIIHTGITDSAPPLLQFTKTDQANINLKRANFTIVASSPEDCAFICVNSSRLRRDKFECFSFDFCKVGESYVCSLYNYSRTSDTNVLIEPDQTCDHYAKNTDIFDSCPKEVALKEIRNAVLMKRFNITITNSSNAVLISFPSIDIAETQNGGGFNGFGGDSNGIFMREFKPFNITYMFNEAIISNDARLFLRKRNKISVIECARYCVTEASFSCESFTYDFLSTECKWSSIYANITYMVSNPSSAWYLRDPLYNYIEFPFKVTQEKDNKAIEDVIDESQCAKYCDNEKDFTCRSFNYCPSIKQCLLSLNHIHNPNKNPNIIPNPICTHFSKKSINDYEMIPQLEITNLNPRTKLFNVTAEQCAELCSYEDTYLCRSFTNYIDTNKCYLYQENLVDSSVIDIQTTKNKDCYHYSRIYITENGNKLSVNTSKTEEKKEKTVKYSAGSIVGILFALLVGCLSIGLLFGFIYLKRIKGTNTLNNIQFKNINYADN